MFSEVEREIQSHRLRGFLTQADAMVWNKSGFPKEHRPDIAFLVPRIHTGTKIPEADIPHPRIKPEVLREMRQMQFINEQNKAVWWHTTTREIVVREDLIGRSDQELRGPIYYAAASDLVYKVQTLSPDKYTSLQREHIETNLKRVFPKNAGIRLKDTTIQKTGFLEQAMVGQYSVGMLYDAKLLQYLNEIYPTAHEVITDQIVRRRGDIGAFDYDIQQENVVVPPSSDHPLFTQTLFAALQFIDWRNLLTAYKIGTLNGTQAVLEEWQKPSKVAAGIFVELFNAMQEDEEAIQTINEFFK